jgi:hypothetical protein
VQITYDAFYVDTNATFMQKEKTLRSTVVILSLIVSFGFGLHAVLGAELAF